MTHGNEQPTAWKKRQKQLDLDNPSQRRLLRTAPTVVSFQVFEQAIVSSALRHVAEHWNKVRCSRSMPSWGDIQPSQITAELPIIWSYKYDRAADTFTGRLAGDKIQRNFGTAFRGLPMAEAYPKEDFPRLFAKYKRVVCEPALYWGEGMVYRHVDKQGHGERIILPLASDGVLGDGILGVTKYHFLGCAPTLNLPEREEWFPLPALRCLFRY